MNILRAYLRPVPTTADLMAPVDVAMAELIQPENWKHFLRMSAEEQAAESKKIGGFLHAQ